jgi:hypothetical protein
MAVWSWGVGPVRWCIGPSDKVQRSTATVQWLPALIGLDGSMVHRTDTVGGLVHPQKVHFSPFPSNGYMSGSNTDMINLWKLKFNLSFASHCGIINFDILLLCVGIHLHLVTDNKI